MIRRTLPVAALVFLSLPAAAEVFTTAELISRSISRQCLDWKVIGTCFWLVCGHKCHIRTTYKIRHRLPDLVVTTHPHTTPWVEISVASRLEDTAADAVLGAAAGGDPSRQNTHTSVVRFKEALVAGNPAAQLRNTYGMKFLCKSQSKPLHTYFDSTSPANLIAWRNEGSDQLKIETWTPGLREIGQWPLHTWGAVYPRSGFLLQPEDPKAGAVIAQRAIDIVTRIGQSFQYTFLGPASNEKTDSWQMLSPQLDKTCAAFGSTAAWSHGRESEDGNYAFNYWREYECCIPRSGKLIKDIEF